MVQFVSYAVMIVRRPQHAGEIVTLFLDICFQVWTITRVLVVLNLSF